MRVFTFVALCACAVGACQRPDPAARGSAPARPTPEGAAAPAPAQLRTTDLAVGSGAEAVEGRNVSVHYIGRLTNGKKFDSSYERGQPIDFVLGQRMVIAGWDQGVRGMKVGGKRRLTIPPHLGYGEAGMGSAIPPNSTLVFEVELVDVR